MKPTLILGVGSPYGEDQIGMLVAASLLKDSRIKSFIPKQLEIFSCDRPGLNLLSYLQDKQYERLIIIDAIQSNNTPGTIQLINKAELASFQETISSHGVDLGSAINMAETLQLLPKDFLLLGIEMSPMAQDDYFLDTSSEKISIVNKVVDYIITIIKNNNKLVEN